MAVDPHRDLPPRPGAVAATDAREPPDAAGLAHSMDVLFDEWRDEQARVDLSDLRPQDIIVFVIFWALFGVVLLQFYSRYILNDSLGWTEEIARYLLIGVTFVGSVTAMRKGSHIAVEVGLKLAPERLRHGIEVAIDACVTVFCGAMAYHGWILGNRANQYMVSIDVPKSVIYWGVSAALAAMALYAAIRLWRRLTGRRVVIHAMTLD